VNHWCAVVPQKPLAVAKSRVELEPAHRCSLATAMLRDTVAAVAVTEGVDHVLVLLEDAADAVALPGRDVMVLPSGGLNRSIEMGAAVARRRFRGHGLLVVPADLPALRPAELAGCLAEAAGHPRAYLPDAEGVGTTILTVTGAGRVQPAYGAGSARAHAAGGAHMLGVNDATSARTDVDDLGSLAAALALGCGPHTRAAWAALAPTLEVAR
jgi:2-phospho-L-lactate guanylyltransferase